MENAREKKNEFLRNMYGFRVRIDNALKKWQVFGYSNLADIYLDKTILMEKQFDGDQFYQTLIGALWMNQGIELLQDELSDFEKEYPKGGFFRGYRNAHLQDKFLDEYHDICFYTEHYTILDLNILFADLLKDYIEDSEGITEEEIEEVLKQAAKELIVLGGEQYATDVIEFCMKKLAKDKIFQTASSGLVKKKTL